MDLWIFGKRLGLQRVIHGEARWTGCCEVLKKEGERGGLGSSTGFPQRGLVHRVNVWRNRFLQSVLGAVASVNALAFLAWRLWPWIYSCFWMLVIVNPRSGRGAGSRILPLLRKELKIREMQGDIALTTGPGHASELAKVAREGEEGCVVVVGGDGTVSEVAGSLAYSTVRMGVIAVGTGNDFARSLGLPLRNVRRALDVIKRNRTCRVDLGWAGERYFVSLLGVGFPALVANRANQMRILTGTPAFLMSVCRQILRMQAVPVTIEMDGRLQQLMCSSILIQNTPYTGGGLRIAPAAKLDDGELDVVLVDEIGKLDLLWNLPRVYRGRHIDHRHFRMFRCRSVEVNSTVALEGTVDGDAFGLTPLKAEIRPSALTMIAPVPVPGVRVDD